MPLYVDDPKIWRDRAEEARVQAEQMSEEASRGLMLGVAESYEKMAERAEARIGPNLPLDSNERC
jgi:hypothetical protein